MAQRISNLIAAGASAAALCIPALAFGQAAPAQCPMVFDYETDAAGNAIVAGQDLSSAYSAWGADLIVWNTQNMSSQGLGIAFDSSNPTGGDWDLGTPNQAYGGPGQGSGGASNSFPLGNLLISAENFVDANGDGLIDTPDDDANGAWFEYFFDAPTCIFSITNIDSGDGEAAPDLVAYNAAGQQIEWINIPGVGNNGVVTSTFEVCGVDHIMYDIYGSGAMDDLVLCVGGTEEVCDGLDNDGDGEVDEGFDAVQPAQADQYYGGSAGHAVWLPGIGTDFVFDPDGVFAEDASTGTATINGIIRRLSNPSAQFAISGTFTGATTTPGSGSPKLELSSSAYVANGGPVDPSTWSYYTSFSALLTGQGDYAGAVVNLSPRGPNFQVGAGASGKNAGYGAAAWLNWITVSQPNSGSFPTSGTGDYNWTLVETCGVEICDGLDNDGDGAIDEDFDADNDGWTTCGGDCDDTNPNTNPDCPDVCNGVDDDCDGSIDEDFDQDGDGYTTCNGDCDDTDAAINPGATEICDGVDNDCDGSVDEGFDQDNDGWTTCGGDCDDNNPGANPDCPDICNGIDDDCDGSIDEDFDQDGDGYTTCNGDCDDTNAAVNPGATEVCNGIDDDCDGVIPSDELDLDGDGVAACDGDCAPGDGNVSPNATEVCDGVDNDCDGAVDEGFDNDNDGWTSCGGDCDDNNPGANPDCPDICNGIDDDCDGSIDEDFDQDGDGYTTCGGDCDDTNASVNPGATEVCNGVDDDCDGVIPADEADADNDGFRICDGDCDDNNPNANPSCPDICNGIDDDCDGLIDEDFDQDGDGVTTCGGDCDDTDANVNPGATEVCDGVDNDCDGAVDENGVDGDGDGYSSCDGDCDDTNAAVNPGAAEACDGLDTDCDGTTPANETDGDGDGFMGCDGDCDDSEDTVYPGAPEICDGLDNDCDGVTPTGETDWDGDGQAACDGDCNDGDPTIYDGADEFCDNIDTDCDGAADNGFDQDGDGIPDCIDTCPMVVDNDNDPWGNTILAGDDAGTAYQGWGVTIERYEDENLSIPLPAPTSPSGTALDNVQEAGAGNTWWIVNFSSSTCVHSIDVLDVDTFELAAQVILFDVNVQTIATFTASGLGDNTLETLDLGGTCGVYVMLIDFYGDGGWDNLNVCVDPTGVAEVCGDGVDNDGDGEVDENCIPVGDDDDAAGDDDDAAGDDDDDAEGGGEEEEEGCSQVGGDADPKLALLLLAFTALGIRRRLS